MSTSSIINKKCLGCWLDYKLNKLKIMEVSTGFGKQMLDRFMMEPGLVNLNHGSFGACPRTVWNKKLQYQALMYQSPQKWHRTESEKILEQVRQQTGEIVNASLSNIFIVTNTSTGANSFLRSISWTEGDVILTTNTAYDMVNKVLQYLVSTYKIQLLIVNFARKDFTSSQTIMDKFRETLQGNSRVIKMAVIDHISSRPAIIFPIQQMVECLHQKGIPVFVDGAHAVGQVDIDLQKVNPQGYVSNFHKWGFGPMSSAFLYVSPKYIKLVNPCVIGNYYGQKLDRQFFWEGSRNLSDFCALSQSFKFLKEMKSKGMDSYIRNLCEEATLYLSNYFNTEPLTQDPRLYKFMSNVQVPLPVGRNLYQITQTLFAKHNIWINLFQFDGKVYWRLSACVYNVLEDFKQAGSVLMDFITSQ